MYLDIHRTQFPRNWSALLRSNSACIFLQETIKRRPSVAASRGVDDAEAVVQSVIGASAVLLRYPTCLHCVCLVDRSRCKAYIIRTVSLAIKYYFTYALFFAFIFGFVIIYLFLYCIRFAIDGTTNIRACL